MAVMIVFDLGRYIEDGSVELEGKNFRPGEQNASPRHHFLSMFTNPWGNHHPVEDLETLWDLHAGSNYGGGIKMFSWTNDSFAEKSTVLPEAWENDGPQHLKIAWQGKQLQYFCNGRLFLTHTHADDLKLRFLFPGRDLTVSADLVTDFKNNQYPALVGPIYSNLVVQENIFNGCSAATAEIFRKYSNRRSSCVQLERNPAGSLRARLFGRAGRWSP